MKSKILAIFMTAALLSGCLGFEGDRRTASLTKEEPFASLRGKRVTLLRPIRIQDAPAYTSGFGAPPATGSDNIAWVARVNGIPGKSKGLEHRDEVEKLLVGRTLPAGTVIRLEEFNLVRDYALAWLPGQDTTLPWYPGRGLLPYPTMFYVQFTSAPTSDIGRQYGAEVVLRYRWGYGTQLWAAPWEPKTKVPVFVGNLGRSFEQPR